MRNAASWYGDGMRDGRGTLPMRGQEVKDICQYRMFHQLLYLLSFLVCFVIIEAFTQVLRIFMLCGRFQCREDHRGPMNPGPIETTTHLP
ncbi:MAG TPA: hypothetical protein VKF36_21505 [Syntrophorhabdales bacterium]|nr:hypothetical protein [Syntrophorhabdales bacterium]